MIRETIGDQVIGVCSICRNESIYPKDSEMVCTYCTEYKDNALKHNDIDSFLRFLFASGELKMLDNPSIWGPFENLGLFEGKSVVRCIHCGVLQYRYGNSCTTCGGNHNFNVSSKFKVSRGFKCKICLHFSDVEKGKCKGCERVRTNPTKVAKLGNNYVGRIYNNLQVIKQYRTSKGILCDVKCLYSGCGKIQTELLLYDVIKKQRYCEVEAESVKVYCRACQTVKSVSNKDAYTDSYTCNTCNIEIPMSLKTHANDTEKYTEFKTQLLMGTYGYDNASKEGILTKHTRLPGLYQVATIWNTRHLIMTGEEIENSNFSVGGKVGDGLFSTDRIWEV